MSSHPLRCFVVDAYDRCERCEKKRSVLSVFALVVNAGSGVEDEKKQGEHTEREREEGEGRCRPRDQKEKISRVNKEIVQKVESYEKNKIT